MSATLITSTTGGDLYIRARRPARAPLETNVTIVDH